MSFLPGSRTELTGGWRLTEAGETALGHAYGGGSQLFSMWVVASTTG